MLTSSMSVDIQYVCQNDNFIMTIEYLCNREFRNKLQLDEKSILPLFNYQKLKLINLKIYTV